MRLVSGVAGLALLVSGCSLTGQDSSKLYSEMADSDVEFAASAMQTGLEKRDDGRTEPWANPDTGRHGSITPVETYVSDAGFFCRRYKETMSLDGGNVGWSYNHACRNNEGLWIWRPL